jgi:small-conductance mechanosensitive channel
MTPAEIIGVGGPAGAIALALGYFLRYLIQRRTAERSSESGIVETTNATLKLVREQQSEMASEVRSLREENTDLRSRLRLKDEQIDKIYDQNSELTRTIDEIRHESAMHTRELTDVIEMLRHENTEMRRRLEVVERYGGEVPPPPLPSGPPLAGPSFSWERRSRGDADTSQEGNDEKKEGGSM